MPQSVFPSTIWRPLTAHGDPAHTVLAVDFDATGRPEARFSDLLKGLDEEVTLLETVPHTDSSDAADLVELWVRPHEEAKTQVRAVFGYCAGAVFAAALVDRISGWQAEPPALMLFDPEISDPRSLLWQFYKTVGIMAESIGEKQLAEARQRAQQVCGSGADMDTIARELTELTIEIGDPALTKAGLGKARRDELFTVFASFLRYLALASQIDPREQWRRSVTFSSTSVLNGMRAMRAGGLEIEVATEFEAEVEHDRLLADPKVAAEVRRLLESGTFAAAREQR